MKLHTTAAPAARWIDKLGSLCRRARPSKPRAEPAWAPLLAEVRARRLTYCGPPKLEAICQAIDGLREKNIRGAFVEAGCALGGSAIVIGSLKPPTAPFYVFDVFGMIPPPTANDEADSHARYAEIESGRSAGIQGDKYYGYVPELRQVVEQNLRSFGLDLDARRIQLVEGLFENTLQVAEPIALAHIDCDWYDSVKVCIGRLAPHIVPGGAVIFDDYSSYAGCRRAVDEWLQSNDEFSLVRVHRSATIERVQAAPAAGRQPFNLHEAAARTWDGRARAAVELWLADVQPARSAGKTAARQWSIADWGCGKESLRTVLSAANITFRYQGYDLIPQTPACQQLDLSCAAPAAQVDVVFALGLLEYLSDLPAFFRRLRGAADYAVVSYVAADSSQYKAADCQERGWLHHLRSEEVERLIDEAGFRRQRRVQIDDGKTFLWLLAAGN